MKRTQSPASAHGVRLWWLCGVIRCRLESFWAAWGWEHSCLVRKFCIGTGDKSGMENIMKRMFLGSTVAIFLTIALSAVSNAQTATPSLGDYARSVRQSKPQGTKAPAKVYDNDSIPSA